MAANEIIGEFANAFDRANESRSDKLWSQQQLKNMRPHEEWYEPWSRGWKTSKRFFRDGMIGATMTGIGASTGYVAGKQLGLNPTAMTIAGGVGGLGLALGTQGIIHNRAAILEKIGTPAYNMGASLYEGIKSGKVLNTLENIGGTSLSAVGTAAKVGGVAAIQTVGEMGAIAKSMLRPNPSKMLGYSLNAFGKVAVGTGIVLGGLKKAFDAHEQIHMGASDGAMITATPESRSSTMNYAGATGDLNFAMYANRRG